MFRVFVGVDLRALRVVGAVEDEAGGERARSDHPPGLDQLGLTENKVGRSRRIEDRGDAVGQVGRVLPRPLGVDVHGRVVQVGVLVEQEGEPRQGFLFVVPAAVGLTAIGCA